MALYFDYSCYFALIHRLLYFVVPSQTAAKYFRQAAIEIWKREQKLICILQYNLVIHLV